MGQNSPLPPEWLPLCVCYQGEQALPLPFTSTNRGRECFVRYVVEELGREGGLLFPFPFGPLVSDVWDTFTPFSY